MTSVIRQRGRFAARIAALHFTLSLLVAAALALLVFLLWYPYPYRGLMGSFHLFWLVVGVDVCCGPLLTFVLSSPTKKRRERWLDYSLVALIQLAAFAYGLHGVYLARPVVLVFESDRLRALAPPDIKQDELAEAPEGYRRLPWHGRLKVAARPARNGAETLDAIEQAMRGYDIGQRPSWWMPYRDARASLRQRARPLASLIDRLHDHARENLRQAAMKTGLPPGQLFYLPLTSPRSSGWTAILNRDMEMIAAAPVDAFSTPTDKEKN